MFSGIGGFDLAAEWAGWTNAFNCEIDPFCRRVLKYHFPNAIQYDNIKTTDFAVWRGRIDVLTAGFPCQPFSVAGKRKGTDDNRYLWPEVSRAVREIRPRWVVGENVRGFVNWSYGMVLDTVFADLETLGYEVQPFILPACAVGAPHRRDRVWIVAHRADAGPEGLRERQKPADKCGTTADPERFGGVEVCKNASTAQPVRNGVACKGMQRSVADADSFGSPISRQTRGGRRGFENRNVIPDWHNFPTQPPVRSRNDGLPAGLDGITFPAWRRESIKAYGNAIVPQVFYQIAETINQYERL
ncbi:MAG: DNA cytosine methyltransferase [Bacteroides cellulosilyticus]|nr:DNA cytosine methyltransferase [Bacteroides cellulosilyticus]